MGAGVWAMFNPARAAWRPEMDGKALLWEIPALDQLARRRGVCTLTSFGDTRPLPDGVDPEDVEAVEAAIDAREEAEPWSEWFSAEDGKTTIRAILDALAAGHDVPPMRYSVEEVSVELRELLRCLELAAEAGARFRLDVLP